MRNLRISCRAANDLAEIADYTIAEFGIAQARRYRALFDTCFESLSERPGLGASAGKIVPGLRRIRQQAHIVFYTCSEDEILIVRVLHHSMDFQRHL